MASLAEETRLYQAALEAERVDPEDPELAAEVVRARAALEDAWVAQEIAAFPDAL